MEIYNTNQLLDTVKKMGFPCNLTISKSALSDELCADDIKEITEKVAEKEQDISSERGTYWHIAELTKVAIAETLNKVRSI